MPIGVLTLQIQVPGCKSLKEKRSRLKPLLTRLHREFNVSVAEVERQDMWQEAVLACALVSNDSAYTQRALQTVLDFTERCWPELNILQHRIELI